MPYKTDPNTGLPTGEWQPEDDSVAKNLTGLLSSSSPLIKAAETRGKQYANSRGLLNSSLAGEASTKAVIESALPIASQDASQTAQKNLTAQGLFGNKQLQGQNIESSEKIAFANVAAHDREKATAAVAAANASYLDAFKSIASNENIPKEARDQFNVHLGAIRDSDLNLVEQLYGIDLEWPSTAGEAVPTA